MNDSSFSRLLWLAAAVVACACVGYVLFTGNVWEDYLITFRFSRHFARGDGLVYIPGERVHGFTSFFNVMIPAVADWLYGGESIMPALTVYRTACIAALTAAVATLGLAMRRDPTIPAAAIMVLAVAMAVDLKTVAYAGNGQETAFVWLFAAIGILAIERGIVAHWLLFGLSATGLMYTRPDGFVFAAILGLAGLVIPVNRENPRRSVTAGFVPLVKAAGVCVACYAPWLAWVWRYYGTPVPHTVIAKVNAYGDVHAARSPLEWSVAWAGHTLQDATSVYAPIYFNPADWPAWTPTLCHLLVGLSIAPLLMPAAPGLARRSALAFLLGLAYLGAIHTRIGLLFPWYTTFTALAGTVSIATAGCWLVQRCADRTWARVVVAATLLGVGVGMAVLSYHGWRQLALQQQEIEWGVRAKVGRWLAEHAGENDRVLLEPIGYIGFFSNAKLYDYPGLVSPAVVDARRRGHRSIPEVAAFLRPEWLVLRRNELADASRHPELRKTYDVVQQFQASPRLRDSVIAGGCQGSGWLAFDAEYTILKRR
jgi:hypothetical protein